MLSMPSGFKTDISDYFAFREFLYEVRVSVIVSTYLIILYFTIQTTPGYMYKHTNLTLYIIFQILYISQTSQFQELSCLCT
jgi:hypothetical protein